MVPLEPSVEAAAKAACKGSGVMVLPWFYCQENMYHHHQDMLWELLERTMIVALAGSSYYIADCA
jgi:hypothetical protein